MNLLFRSKKLIIKAYTFKSATYEYFTVAKSHHFYPEWWKKLPTFHEELRGALNVKAPTMKTCAGIIEIYKKGIILPLWSDLQFRVAENNQWAAAFSDHNTNQPTSHPRYQIGENNAEFNNCIHIKIDAPWLFIDVNKTGIPFLQQGCFWNNISTQRLLHICPGVLNYKFQHSVNINAFLSSNTPEEFVIPANTPIMQMIPLSEKELELQVELISYEDFNKINDKHAATCFHNKYERLKKIAMQKESQSKCPFSKLFAK
jgi:hypothetical protein